MHRRWWWHEVIGPTLGCWTCLAIFIAASFLFARLLGVGSSSVQAIPTATLIPIPTSTPIQEGVEIIAVGARCRDGWRSTATGRGACSHHGGVREWLYATVKKKPTSVPDQPSYPAPQVAPAPVAPAAVFLPTATLTPPLSAAEQAIAVVVSRQPLQLREDIRARAMAQPVGNGSGEWVVTVGCFQPSDAHWRVLGTEVYPDQIASECERALLDRVATPTVTPTADLVATIGAYAESRNATADAQRQRANATM